MTLILLFFIPILMLVVVANMGETALLFRRLSYGLLLLISGLVTASGVVLLTVDTSQLPGLPASQIPLLPAEMAVRLLIAGLLALALVTLAVVADWRGRSVIIRGQCLSCPVALTALVLALLYAGGNLALVQALPDPAMLADLDLNFGMGELAAQSVGMVTLALLGVGLGMRRDWPAVRRRLGLRALTGHDVGMALLLTMGMVGVSMVVGALIALLFPDSMASADAINEVLISAFSSVGGALLLGLLSGVGEEFLYRGALQPVFGLGVTSFIFALHHVQYLNATLLLIFILGLMLGWIRNRWGLSVAALSHACYNSFLVLVAISAASVGS